MLLLSALAYPAAPPSEVLRPPASERRELLRVRSGHTPLGSWEETTDEPMHKTVCDGRPCRPGEGNRVGYEHWKQPYRPLDEAVVRALSKKPPHGPDGPQYAKLIAAAGHLADASKFIALAAADFDYRELAENWHAAAARSGVRCALLYVLDAPAHAHLTARLGAASVVNGTANLDAWATTKLMRHIQRALAERHMAAAALATAGFDVLLCDSTAVFVADPRPRLLSVPASDADVLVGRLHCNRPGKNRLGCAAAWNFLLLRGASAPPPRRSLVARLSVRSIERGMVDFYLRWWMGHHCTFIGFDKTVADARPRIEGGFGGPEAVAAAPNAVALATLTAPSWCDAGGGSCLRLGLLPMDAFPPAGAFVSSRATAVVGRATRPPSEPVHRLRLDRYDQRDFAALVARMREEGLWLLGS